MVMVGHEAVGVAEPIENRNHPPEYIQKRASVGIVEIDRAAGVPASHYMVNGSGILDSQRSGPYLTIYPASSKSKT
jgi:hypothetical protein